MNARRPPRSPLKLAHGLRCRCTPAIPDVGVHSWTGHGLVWTDVFTHSHSLLLCRQGRRKSFEAYAAGFVNATFAPVQLEVLAWTRLPYLCMGGAARSVPMYAGLPCMHILARGRADNSYRTHDHFPFMVPSIYGNHLPFMVTTFLIRQDALRSRERAVPPTTRRHQPTWHAPAATQRHQPTWHAPAAQREHLQLVW